MIFTSESQDKGSRRARDQEVNATMPAVPQYMHWSDCDISWSRKDHPSILPNPGNYPLVVDAMVAGPKLSCKFSRVLIDGGSTINILYRDTMVKLGLSERDLERSRMTFHGIVPGLSCTPLGRIRLDVIFGTEENFRREPIWFEVADLSSPYHALMGLPTFAKFMFSAHETYLKMKIPGPNGVITVIGDFRKSLECTSAGGNLAYSQVITEEKHQLGKVIAMAQAQSKAPLPVGPAKRENEESIFQSAKDSKKVALDPSDSTKLLWSELDLATNRKASSSSSSVRTRDIFAWSPQDMSGVPRELAEHKLHIRPGSKPVKQPLQRFSEDKRRAIGEEIAKLLAASFIMEVFYPE